MAREWLLAGVSEEELRPAPHIEPPKTPQGKWQNFWYHYKWHTIGAVFGAVVLAFLIGQLLSRDDPDYRILLVTQKAPAFGVTDVLQQELTAYGEDVDGDGKVEVSVESVFLDDTGYQMYTASSAKLAAYLASGDVMFFVMEPSYYNERLKPQLSDGYTFFDTLNVDSDALLENGGLWNWNGSALQQNAAFKDTLPKDLYFGVRATSEAALHKEQSTTQNETSLALLRKLITAMAAE